MYMCAYVDVYCIYIYLQSIQSYIAPPIAAVFLIGIFWKKANGTGAIYTLIAGGVIGAIRLVAEIYSRNVEKEMTL